MEPTAHPTTLSEPDAVAVLCLMAAQADGLRPEERARLADVFEALGGVDPAQLLSGWSGRSRSSPPTRWRRWRKPRRWPTPR